MEKEVTDTREDAVEEERIQRMIETERELLEERREAEHAEPVTDAGTDDLETDDDPVATGTIRTVEKVDSTYSSPELRVELFADGEVWEDTLDWPSDPSDPDAAVNRLCHLCGVEPGRVADLQGERVPVVYDDISKEYDLALPSTASSPARAVFRLWWWLRRRDIDPGVPVTAMKAALGVGVYAVGWRAFWTIGVEGAGEATFPEFVGMVFGLGPEAITGIVGTVLSVPVGIALLLFGAVSPIVTIVTVGVALLAGGEAVLKWLDDTVNPF